MLVSTLSTQKPPDLQAETHREVQHDRLVENILAPDLHQRLEGMLQEEREERKKLEVENEKLREEKDMLEDQRQRDEGLLKFLSFSVG